MVHGKRGELLHAAVRVSVFSVCWSAVVGMGALFAGAVAGSLALVGFGLDSLIDSSASVVLVWRFRVERNAPLHAERVERTAARVVGATLLAIALYIVIESIRALVTRVEPSNTIVGDAIAIASLVVLPIVARVKFRLAARLGSPALRGDGVLTAAGAVLALVTLLALVLDNAFGWWWSDAVAALVIAALLATEGARSLNSAGNYG